MNAQTDIGDRCGYPLWCVDNGDEGSECRYSGPYDTEAEAIDSRLDCGGSIRRCRAISAVGLIDTNDILHLFDEIQGEKHQWADWEEPLAEARSTAEAALKVFLAKHLQVKIYVCEGDDG